MEADERIRRFRTHVVQELFQTEREYTAALEFTVSHIMVKMRQKAEHDQSLSEDMIAAVFCNMHELLAVHQKLICQLEETLAGKPSYDSMIAGCYLKHKEQFAAYKTYGENNEHAQKVLYEMEDKPVLKAFFLGVMLLGGKSDASISSYVFKPIQRICKYPLLFKELLRYTPEDHEDYGSTEQALAMMRELCSVINEAKRRVEKLEVISDWQGTVEGWEGSPVVDTCNELVKEGALIKISAGNMQERMFFLFDNLLVYCKKLSGFPLRTKAEQKTLLFRGRIPVESLEMENIADGTADYHTSGISVCNGWKVRNIAKNKWFVLVARTAADKQQWMEAFRVQKDRIKKVAAGIAKDTRTLMLDKGSKLHCRLKQEGKLLQDHRYRLRVYPKSFCGSELVQWLIEIGEAGDASEAVRLGQGLLESGVIHHVGDKHQFKDSALVYRFRYDDGTFHSKWETSDSLARGMRVYTRLHSFFEPLIKDHRTGLRLVKSAISGQRLIDWLLHEKDINAREEGMVLGSHFMAIGLLKHVTDEHKFKDSVSLYYRFVPDHVQDEVRKTPGADSPTARLDFSATSTSSCVSLLVPYSADLGGHGFTVGRSHAKVGSPVKVDSVQTGSPAEEVGMFPGQQLVQINKVCLMGREEREEERKTLLDQCLVEMESARQQQVSLEVSVLRNSAEYCTLRPGNRSLGFQIKGTCPVVIQKVEKGSVAAQAGLTPGCCILKVGEENMVQASHGKVVEAIKSALKQQEEAGGDPVLKLKVGVGMVQQLCHYQYESTEDNITQVLATCQDSSYTYSLPAQLLKLYSDEASHHSKLLSVKQLKESRIQDYVTEVSVLRDSYSKAYSALKNPRYPSYRPYGASPSSMLEACPINLHTFGLAVGSVAPVQPSSADSSFFQEGRNSTIEHFCTSVAIPALMNRTFTTSDREVLSHCWKVRQLLASFQNMELELIRDAELLQRLANHVQQQESPATPPPGTAARLAAHNGVSISVSPASSPFLNQRGGLFGRERAVSVVNPNPVIKLVLDGVARRLQGIRKLLDDDYLRDLVQHTAPCMKDCSQQAVLKHWSEAVAGCSDELAQFPNSSPQVVDGFSRSLLTTISSVMRDVELHLLTSIALHDNVDTTYTMDRLFSQCLVAAVTAFAHQLCAAVRGQLNPVPDYIDSATEASQQWLELIAEKGVLLCFTGLLLPSVTSEVAQLKDLMLVVEQLRTVSFHIKECTEFSPSNNTLPPVTLSGDHSNLHVTFFLPYSVMDQLPDGLTSGSAISLHPVLFNKGLVELSEESQPYCWEQELNDSSFIQLRDYYRALRHFHLNRATLPEDDTERKLALEQISQPLVALDVLVRQLEVAIREPSERGVGLLSLLSELTQRMGGVRVLTCESGVYRCQAALTLEQVLVMIRCHGLPPRCLRPALNILRSDFLPLLEKKNSADKSKAFPQPPPWLYQVDRT